MRSRLLSSALLLAGIVVAGTVGYRLIEGASWWDALYMTVITLTTVGYGEVFPLSRAGEVFTVALLLAGLGVILVALTEVARTVVEGEVRRLFGRVRRSRMLDRITGHDIVCGWGRMGKAAVGELRRGRRPVVVVERNLEKVRALEELGIPVVAGDATSDAVLRMAGIQRARGLVACLNDDAHNVYTVLVARSLNPSLFIVARAGEEGAEARIRHAGADRAVNPYQHGGERLAHMLTKPTVVDFLDFSLGPPGERQLQLEQVALTGGSALPGASLAAADLRRRCGVGVVAVQRGARLFPNPEPDLRLEEGDVLVVLGTREQLDGFESIVSSPVPGGA
ncbi:MAG: TrkA-N domain protein [Acidobacteria bacterium]|jgi:voltage-gated potassium channel|nr:TrkA-N domain protein [Acidobacteriota bacterium]